MPIYSATAPCQVYHTCHVNHAKTLTMQHPCQSMSLPFTARHHSAVPSSVQGKGAGKDIGIVFANQAVGLMPFPPHIHVPTPLPATANIAMPPQSTHLETPMCREGVTATPQVAKAKAEMPTPHFFKGAQRGMAPPLVPSVWGTTSTSMPNVPRPSSGMEEMFVCGETSKVISYSLMASQCVSTSKPWQGAQTCPTPHDTYVQGVGSQDTAPSSVLRYRRANLLTPYKPVHGTRGSSDMGYLKNIQPYTIALCMVFISESLAYLNHTFPLIALLLISCLQNMKKLWRKNFIKGGTLALSPSRARIYHWSFSIIPPLPCS